MADLPAVEPVAALIAVGGGTAAASSKPATAANSKPATANPNAAAHANAAASSSMFSVSAAANATGIASYLAPTAAGTFDLAIGDLLEECADAAAEREAVNNVLLRFNSELRAAYRFYACHFSSTTEAGDAAVALAAAATVAGSSGESSGANGFASGSAAAAAAIRAVLEHTSNSAEESSAARDDAKAALSIHETRALRAREEAVLRYAAWSNGESQ